MEKGSCEGRDEYYRYHSESEIYMYVETFTSDHVIVFIGNTHR
jgi:hypothetical protein